MGNITSCAEFNFYTDPEAAHIVLTSACCPIYLLPWETCLRIDISLAWRFNVLGAIQNSQMNLLNTVEKKVWAKSRFTSWIPCDAILAATLLRPDIVMKSQKCHATVELRGIHTRGQVVIDHLKLKDPNVHLVEEVDTSVLKKMLLWAAGHPDLDNVISK
jgi:inosine-uridine nucleoside N-ribohydrolase